MKESTKLPKTFLVRARASDGKEGYVKFVGYQSGGDILYRISLTEKISEASRYVTLDNSKAKAKELKERFLLEDVQVIDESSRKTYLIH